MASKRPPPQSDDDVRQQKKRHKSTDTPELFNQRLAALRTSPVFPNCHELTRLIELATGKEKRTAQRIIESMPSDLKAPLEAKRFLSSGPPTLGCTAGDWTRIRAWIEASTKHDIKPWKEKGIRQLFHADFEKEGLVPEPAPIVFPLPDESNLVLAERSGRALFPSSFFTCGLPPDEIAKLVREAIAMEHRKFDIEKLRIETEEKKLGSQHELEMEKLQQLEKKQERKEQFTERALIRSEEREADSKAKEKDRKDRQELAALRREEEHATSAFMRRMKHKESMKHYFTARQVIEDSCRDELCVQKVLQRQELLALDKRLVELVATSKKGKAAAELPFEDVVIEPEEFPHPGDKGMPDIVTVHWFRELTRPMLERALLHDKQAKSILQDVVDRANVQWRKDNAML